MEVPDYQLIDNTPDQRMLIYLVESYSLQFLIFLSREIPDYSSHGLDHSMHIIKNINAFILSWKIKLLQDEALLLYLAAWIHDIGCIKDRENHHEVSVELMLNNKSLYESLTEKNAICLKYLILAHRARYSIESVPKNYEEIRLRMICSIFRLMDACEICYMKCPKAVYDVIETTLNDKSKEIWNAHMNIIGLTFKKPQIQILVNDINKCQFIIDDLKKEINTIEGTFRENHLAVPTVIRI